MRPENKWNKQAAKDKRKRKSNRRPPAVPAASTRSQSRILAAKRSESSPPPTESSSPNDEEITPKNGAGSGSTGSQSRPSNRRANSAEPPKSSNKNDRWQQEDAFEALRRAIQSSPARNLEKRNVPYKEPNLTPNPVRRTLFQSAKDDTAMKALSEALINSVRRSPRSSPRKSKSTSNPEINTHAPGDGLDHLFEGENEEFVDLDPPHSPTPRQKTSAANAQAKNKENIATPSKQPSKRNDPANQQAPGQELSSTKTKNDGSGMSTYWNSPNSRSFETIDGLVLNIFETDEDSFQTFSHPKTSSNSNWLDWDPSDYVSPGTTAEGITRGQNEMSNAAATSTSEDSNSKEAPHDAGGSMTVEDTEFRSLLLASANDFANFNCSTELSDSDIFDSSLVDPQLFSSMWAKESAITTSPADEKNDGMDQFDPDVISAIIQEVTGRPDTT